MTFSKRKVRQEREGNNHLSKLITRTIRRFGPISVRLFKAMQREARKVIRSEPKPGRWRAKPWRRSPSSTKWGPGRVHFYRRTRKPADTPHIIQPDCRHDKYLHSHARQMRRLVWAMSRGGQEYPFDKPDYRGNFRG